MSLAAWMVLVAALLPIVAAGIGKWGAPGFDNHHPRQWMAGLTGWRARAMAAQSNSHEVFPPFAAAVIIAQIAGAPQVRLDTLAVTFIVLRLIYILCYLRDLATLRSVAWTAGLLCTVLIFLSAA